MTPQNVIPAMTEIQGRCTGNSREEAENSDGRHQGRFHKGEAFGAEVWGMSPGFCSWKKEPEGLLWGKGWREQRLECLSRKFGLDSIGFIPYGCDNLIIFYQLSISSMRAEGTSFIHIFSIIHLNLSTLRAHARCSRRICQSDEQGWFSSPSWGPLLCSSLHGSPAHLGLFTFALDSCVRDFFIGPQTAAASSPRKPWRLSATGQTSLLNYGRPRLHSPAALAPAFPPSSASPCLPLAEPRASANNAHMPHLNTKMSLIQLSDSQIKCVFSPSLGKQTLVMMKLKRIYRTMVANLEEFFFMTMHVCPGVL